MLSQHCAGGAREVRGSCTGGAREVMVGFYAESALHGRYTGGAWEVRGR